MHASHGVCCLRKKLNAGGEYEYIFIDTPKQHIAAKAKTVQAPTFEPEVRAVLNRIQRNETIQFKNR
jgi:hypothetical protein